MCNILFIKCGPPRRTGDNDIDNDNDIIFSQEQALLESAPQSPASSQNSQCITPPKRTATIWTPFLNHKLSSICRDPVALMNSYKPQKLWVVAIDRQRGKTFEDLATKYINNDTVVAMKLDGIALLHDLHDLDEYVESQNKEELDFFMILSQGSNQKLISKSKLDSQLFQSGTTHIGRKWYYIHQKDRKALSEYFHFVCDCCVLDSKCVGTIPELAPTATPTAETEGKFCLNMLQDLSFEYGISDGDLLRKTYVCVARNSTTEYVSSSTNTNVEDIWDISADLDEADLCGCGCLLTRDDHSKHKKNALVFYSRSDQRKLCKQSVENVAMTKKAGSHVEQMARLLRFMDKLDFEGLGSEVVQSRDVGNFCLPFIPTYVQKLWGRSARQQLQYAMWSLFRITRVLASDEMNNWQQRTIVLFGESGCGKSSFGRALCSMFSSNAAFSIKKKENKIWLLLWLMPVTSN